MINYKETLIVMFLVLFNEIEGKEEEENNTMIISKISKFALHQLHSHN